MKRDYVFTIEIYWRKLKGYVNFDNLFQPADQGQKSNANESSEKISLQKCINAF